VGISRTISVMVLAMAIAMLPLSIRVATAAPVAPSVASGVEAMPNSSHHQHHDSVPSGQTQKSLDHGVCIAGCAVCFGLVGASAAEIAYALPASIALMPAYTSDNFPSLRGSPPFRPPRA